MPACPLGTKYQHRGGGLGGGDITKMSENVTHLIIYAPRPLLPPASLQPLTSRFHHARALGLTLLLLLPPLLVAVVAPLELAPPLSIPPSSLFLFSLSFLRQWPRHGLHTILPAFSREINLALLK